MNVYDFKEVVQKAPMTGKVSSRATRLGTKAGGDSRLRVTAANFGGAGDKISRAQEKLKEKQAVTSDPERRIRAMEAEINSLIDQSNAEMYAGNSIGALEKAKEAQAKMKPFEKFLEANELGDFFNSELLFAVGMNLANLYEKNELVTEALAEYSKLLNAKASDSSFLVRVNMGNLYFRQEKFSTAIKMYKMALDMAHSKYALVKFKITRNIGHCYIRIKEFHEAINAYETVMGKFPDLETAFNLLLCLYVTRDQEKMKRAFTDMLAVENYWSLGTSEGPKDAEDPLAKELYLRHSKAQRLITDAAKLIAPVIEPSVIAGFDWVIEALKGSNYSEVLSEIEISKALMFVKQKDIDSAIAALKAFEKKDKKLMNRAATNLGFLYLLEQDYGNAEKYCDMALSFDPYNSKALVNKGNCLFHKKDFLGAKEEYLKAIGVEADCVEALYNLAYVNKKIANYPDALIALEKLNSFTKASPDVLFEMAAVCELMGHRKASLKWFDLLSASVPNDPAVHAKLGALYNLENDEGQAYHHYLESFKLLPTNLETIAWLGIYNVKAFNYTRACFFFERASLLQPKDLKWKLMIASCNRRMDLLEKALKQYKEIQEEEPDNLESLKFIVQISGKLGLDAEAYRDRLRRVERELEAAEGGFVELHNDNMDASAAKEPAPVASGAGQGAAAAPQGKVVRTVSSHDKKVEIDFENDAVLELPE